MSKQVKVVLSGALAGFTGTLRGKQFVKGEYIVVGNEMTLESQLRFLARTIQAFPEGSPELAAAQEYHRQRQEKANGIQHPPPASAQSGNSEAISGGRRKSSGGVSAPSTSDGSGHGDDGPSDGETGLGADGGGHEDSGLRPEQVRSVRNALSTLDPDNDTHWTKDGKPAVEAVATATGDATVGRKLIEAVAPDFTREKAKEI